MTPLPQGVEDALAIAALGWSVIPVRLVQRADGTYDKRPITDKGQSWKDLSTRDTDKIRRLWARDSNAYVGMPMGDGALGIDVDNKHGKHGSEWWEAQPFSLDYTYPTMSGGWHVLALSDAAIGCPQLWANHGVDIRGDGGWLLAHAIPPSRSTLPHLPESLETLLSAPEKDDRRTAEPIGPQRDPALAADPYAVAAVAGELAKLDACQLLGWGGEPWDVTTFAVACNLVEFGNSPWAGLDLDELHVQFLAAAPDDGGDFSHAKHAEKWAGAVQRVAGKGRPNPNTDPANDFDVLTAESVAADGKSGDNSSGWQPVDLTGYLDGTYQPPEAKLMHRNDGVALLYPGMTHSIHGESESGKSMLAQAEVVVQLKAGELVCYLDYEADPGSVLERLQLMGATPADLSRLTYVQPEADHEHSPASRQAFQALLGQAFALAVLDGVNEALAQAPAKARSTGGLGGNDDITAWHDRLPRQIAKRTGAAVVLIDHVAKGPDSGRFAIGGQAKMATISGAAYVVRPKSPLGRNLVGQVDLYVAKDRHGHVRSHAAGQYSSDRMQLAATAVVDGTAGRIRVELLPPVPQPTKDERLQAAMVRVSDWLTANPDSSTRVVRSGTPGNTDADEKALAELVEQGYVARVQRGQGQFHTVIKAFGTGFE